jgi:hypothetical protein
MASQKPLKMAIALLSLAYNQAFILLDTAEGGFLRLRQFMLSHQNIIYFT